LLVAPAAANRHQFANFTRVVNDYLEQPPFNFKNTHKHLGVLKKASKIIIRNIHWSEEHLVADR